jgi:MHS family proline/betaine transporter-like MFS transporter
VLIKILILLTYAIFNFGCYNADQKLIPKQPFKQVEVEKGFNIEVTPKVDILFLIDDSGSMDKFQDDVAANMSLFTAEMEKNKFMIRRFDQVLSEKASKLNIKEVFQHNFNSVVLTIAAGCLTSTSAYLLMTYLSVYFKSQMGATPVEALQYGLFAKFLLMILLPIMGAFSDKFGYTRTMIVSSSMATILAIPIFYMLSINNDAIIHLAITLLAFLAAGIYAPLYPFIMKLFTPEQRYSGIACSLNIGIATCGGLTSMTCLWLVNSTGYGAAAGIYWIAVCSGFIYTISKVQKVSYWDLVSDKMIKAIPVKV